MSVNHKCIVVAPKETAMTIYPEIIAKLNAWQRTKLEEEVNRSNFLNPMHFLLSGDNRSKWSNGMNKICSTDFKSFYFIFSIGGNGNDVNVFTTSVNDQNYLAEGEKIVFHFPPTDNGLIARDIVCDVLINYGRTFVYEIDEDQYREL